MLSLGLGYFLCVIKYACRINVVMILCYMSEVYMLTRAETINRL